MITQINVVNIALEHLAHSYTPPLLIRPNNATVLALYVHRLYTSNPQVVNSTFPICLVHETTP